jgi:hypothetical protein
MTTITREWFACYVLNVANLLQGSMAAVGEVSRG